MFTGWLEILKPTINSLIHEKPEFTAGFWSLRPAAQQSTLSKLGRLSLLMAFSMNLSQLASIVFEDYDLTSSLRNLLKSYLCPLPF